MSPFLVALIAEAPELAAKVIAALAAKGLVTADEIAALIARDSKPGDAFFTKVG